MIHRMNVDSVGFGVFHIVWLIVVILVWVGIIAAIVLGIRWLIRSDRANRLGGSAGGPPPGAPPRPDDPLEILRSRYARGEIDDEEYERRRRILTG